MARPCRVYFSRSQKAALLKTRSGLVLNAINYKTWPLSKAEKAHARKTLMRGCKELLRQKAYW
jgi:hypothetical protein